jgi:HEAT repeat protein
LKTEAETPARPLPDLLRDPSTSFDDGVLRQFSDLDPGTLRMVLPAWWELQPDRRRAAVTRMADLFEEDTRLSYEDFARAAITDPDPLARAAAIRLLAESASAQDAILLADILALDTELDPRLQAARTLGRFVALGELDELDPRVAGLVQAGLLSVLQADEPHQLQRAALEALGYSSRPEVAELISRYLAHPDPHWVASALTAAERSGDNRWDDQVLELMTSPDAGIRLAACRAAGPLYIAAAGPLLLELLEDEEDSDIFAAAIWSLSQIGGEDVQVTLETMLEESEDQALSDFLEEALENLAFNEGIAKDLPFLEIEAEDEENHRQE